MIVRWWPRGKPVPRGWSPAAADRTHHDAHSILLCKESPMPDTVPITTKEQAKRTLAAQIALSIFLSALDDASAAGVTFGFSGFDDRPRDALKIIGISTTMPAPNREGDKPSASCRQPTRRSSTKPARPRKNPG